MWAENWIWDSRVIPGREGFFPDANVGRKIELDVFVHKTKAFWSSFSFLTSPTSFPLHLFEIKNLEHQLLKAHSSFMRLNPSISSSSSPPLMLTPTSWIFHLNSFWRHRSVFIVHLQVLGASKHQDFQVLIKIQVYHLHLLHQASITIVGEFLNF